MTPDDFTRAFIYGFCDQNAASLAELVAADGTVQTLTGLWAEGRAEAEAAFSAEAAGIFSRARLVTGKASTLPLGPDVALLRQRFVVSGAITETGEELPRFGAMLVAVLQSDGLNWRAVNLSFTHLP